MRFQLLALNIDGTLLQKNGSISRATRDAVLYALEKDVYVTLVTNRNFPSAQKVAKTLKLSDALLITHSGALIARDMDEPYIQRKISEIDTYRIVQALEFYACNVRILHERFSYGNRKKLDVGEIANEIFSKGDPVFYPIQFFDSLTEQLRDEPVSAPKIDVYFDDWNELLQAEKVIRETFDAVDLIRVSKNKLEVVPKPVSKLWGLVQLGRLLHIPLSQMVYVGDNWDDRVVIETVGCGVAMWNAAKEIKEVADWVTRSNDENGVAYLVREIFRKQQRAEFLSQYVHK